MSRGITLHPQAKFDPIPPDLDLRRLVENTPTFEWVLRVSVAQIRNLGQQEFEKLVLLHVIQGGRPLVIEKWNEVLPQGLFNANWLETSYDKKQENVRDITNQADIPMTMGHYLRSMRKLANQWTPLNFRDERRQRLYLKDIDCPTEWEEALRKIIPPNLFYMNENITDRGIRNSDENVFRSADSSAAPAGDLMSSLPPPMRAQNLMCYIGHEGTYTPAHREMCASLGQNIMVEASKDSDDGELEGSSIWFMTESKDREVVREYFLSMLGHDIEIEKHFAQINAWKKATFPVYIVEQKPGDFILIPPLAPHQVWNRGTRTMKVAWNRTTVETLEFALHEALPKARLVCRDEQYKNKAIIYFTLQKYYEGMVQAGLPEQMDILGLDNALSSDVKSPRRITFESDFRRLFFLFADIMGDELFGFKEEEVEYIEFDSNITCSFCRANIFNRFLTCKHCVRTLVGGDEDTYDICMECYAMGRSCFCISNLQWCEQWQWAELVENYEKWRELVIMNDSFVDIDESPVPLELVKKRKKKKTLAQVCQEGLKRRPFKDIKKAQETPPSESEGEVSVDDQGRVKRKKRRQRKNAVGRKEKGPGSKRCHVCGHPDYHYKLQACSTPGCKEVYCYGTLYRGFDQMPQDVQQLEHWQCPKCLGICNCGYCRRAGAVNYYLPKRTLLGHDTRLIADDRSVETLVDFRMHNLSWLKYTGEDARSNNSKRMQQLRAQAEQAKSKARSAQEAAETVLTLQNGTPINGDDSILPEDDATLLSGDYTRTDATVIDPENAPVDATEGPGMAIPDEQRSRLHELPGMGYYQQGENEKDRILFDHYEIPTKEKFQLDDPEMSEYVLKSIKAARRRARNKGDDDPEFRLNQRPKKNKPRASEGMPLGAGGIQLQTDDEIEASEFPQGVGVQGSGGIEAEAPGVSNHQSADDANADVSIMSAVAGDVPVAPAEEEHEGDISWTGALRHAKPRISYVEPEDQESEMDDANNIVEYKSNRDRPKSRIKALGSSVDEADNMEIDFPIVTVDDVPEDTGLTLSVDKDGDTLMEEPAADMPFPPRRARNQAPMKVMKKAPPDGDAESDAASTGLPKRCGRPLKGTAANAMGSDNDEKNYTTSEVTKLRGHPPKSAATKPIAKPARGRPSRPQKAVNTPDESDSDEQDSEVEVKPLAKPPPPAVEPAAPKLMSMAERMKAKGKAFKIGQRAGPGAKAKKSKEEAPTSNVSPPAAPKQESAVHSRVTSRAASRIDLQTTCRLASKVASCSELDYFEEVDQMPSGRVASASSCQTSGFTSINLRKHAPPPSTAAAAAKSKKWTMADDPFHSGSDGDSDEGSESEAADAPAVRPSVSKRGRGVVSSRGVTRGRGGRRASSAVARLKSSDESENSAGQSGSDIDTGDDEIPSRVTRGQPKGATVARRGGVTRGRGSRGRTSGKVRGR